MHSALPYPARRRIRRKDAFFQLADLSLGCNIYIQAGSPPIPRQPNMPHKPLSIAPFVSACALAAGLVLAGGGCKTPRGGDELANAVAVGERPVAMSGNSAFFDGQMNVVVTISRGIGRGIGGGKGSHTDKHVGSKPGEHAMKQMRNALKWGIVAAALALAVSAAAAGAEPAHSSPPLRVAANA